MDASSGLLLFDKPAGVTSFDCVYQVKRKLGANRVGHCGTLDPAARGLLMILVGSATRQQDSFLALEKDYWFRAEFGTKTSTGDLEGETIETRPIQHLHPQGLEDVLKTFVGLMEQIPPAYSALKYKGKPYYHYARKGIAIPRAARSITIHALSLLSHHLPYWEAQVVCTRGTYVRTLIEDIAERLGTCATLIELVRERVGPYKRAEALTWKEFHVMKPEHVNLLVQPLLQEPELVHA